MRKEMQEPDLQRLLGRPPEPWPAVGGRVGGRRGGPAGLVEKFLAPAPAPGSSHPHSGPVAPRTAMVPRTRTGGRPSLRVPRQHLCPRLRKQHFPRLENRNRLPAREGGEAATPAAGVVTATPGAELARFLGRASHDSYFSSTQRHQAVAEILARTIYGKEKRAEMVMARLLTEGVYTAAFPLREGPCDLPEYQVPGADLNPPQLLYSYWACWGCWQKYQPLHRIQEDFGDKAAIYFAWKLKTWQQKRHLAGLQDTQIRQEQRRWEEDCELIEFKGQCDEYLEMVLQSRFITIFVAAFPPAPLFALLNNWVEIRPDTQKFCASTGGWWLSGPGCSCLKPLPTFLSCPLAGFPHGLHLGLPATSPVPVTPQPAVRLRQLHAGARTPCLPCLGQPHALQVQGFSRRSEESHPLLLEAAGCASGLHHRLRARGVLPGPHRLARARRASRPGYQDKARALPGQAGAGGRQGGATFVSCSMCNADNNPLCAPACHLSMDIWSPTALCSVSSLCDCALGGEVDMKE
ncbi:uncharacterized protein LOC112402812 [Neophocaena asiaeorientalis asiaeorientalis]|uniref:Anoctamin n=1 Tax=Neophocaena asiaeorientalis asiaeorientalis TaxID=1706337 RepID=A0A341BSP6_NEOAA|nr:uncharacterized protein LOC112402812 [Neophocaena asiaeorientalis asiaeorientalis]